MVKIRVIAGIQPEDWRRAAYNLRKHNVAVRRINQLRSAYRHENKEKCHRVAKITLSKMKENNVVYMSDAKIGIAPAAIITARFLMK